MDCVFGGVVLVNLMGCFSELGLAGLETAGEWDCGVI